MKLAHRFNGPASAPTLVLSSSLGTTIHLWDAQLEALVPHFRVLRFDHPGHGASEPPAGPITVGTLAHDLIELLDELELERVSFCGLSLGGMVGMALALEAPERVDRLVLSCTAAYLGPPEGWHERARIVREHGTAAVAETVVGRWFTAGFHAERPTTVAYFREMLESTPSEGYAACCEAIARWDARDGVHAIRAPTLVIAGAADQAATPADAASLAQAIAGSEIDVLPEAAHLANVEQPALFNRALLRHLGVRPSSEEAA
jgi:3-oxoadipate enol-lactonase